MRLPRKRSLLGFIINCIAHRTPVMNADVGTTTSLYSNCVCTMRKRVNCASPAIWTLRVMDMNFQMADGNLHTVHMFNAIESRIGEPILPCIAERRSILVQESIVAAAIIQLKCVHPKRMTTQYAIATTTEAVVHFKWANIIVNSLNSNRNPSITTTMVDDDIRCHNEFTGRYRKSNSYVATIECSSFL